MRHRWAVVIFSAIGLSSISTSCSRNSPTNGRFIFAIIADKTWGAVLVRADPTTGEIRFQGKEQMQNALREEKNARAKAAAVGKPRSDTFEKKLEALAAKEWLTIEEYQESLDFSSDVASVESAVRTVASEVRSVNRTVEQVLDVMRAFKR